MVDWILIKYHLVHLSGRDLDVLLLQLLVHLAYNGQDLDTIEPGIVYIS